MSNVLFPRCRKPSSHSTISRSRWLVGSSSMRKSGFDISTCARAIRFCCPPLSWLTGCCMSVILSWVSICLALSCTSSLTVGCSEKQASSTVALGSNTGSCRRYPVLMPLRYIMLPLSMLSLPVSIDSRVDLPVPFWAISPTLCPSAMLKEMS